jgi:hypothetical protein
MVWAEREGCFIRNDNLSERLAGNKQDLARKEIIWMRVRKRNIQTGMGEERGREERQREREREKERERREERETSF